MKRKIGMLLSVAFLGAVILCHIAYFVWVRETLSDVGPFWNIAGDNYGMNTREAVDHFIYCFSFVYYFLFGYLWFGRKYFDRWIAGQKDRKTRVFLGLEILCQIGMIFVYAVLWLENITDTMSVLYLDLRKMDYLTYGGLSWVEKYWNHAAIVMLLAPIFLAIVIYGIHFVCRVIQYQRGGYLNGKWILWNLLCIVVVVCLIVEAFRLLQYDESWEEWLRWLPFGGNWTS